MQGQGRDAVGARANQAEIDHGVPAFLDQLGDALRIGLNCTPEIGKSAILHGHDLLLQGFTVSQVVHDYGDICQAITELALERNAPVSTDDFRMLNRCLDEAMAGAVTQYTRERNQSAIDGESARGGERPGSRRPANRRRSQRSPRQSRGSTHHHARGTRRTSPAPRCRGGSAKLDAAGADEYP